MKGLGGRVAYSPFAPPPSPLLSSLMHSTYFTPLRTPSPPQPFSSLSHPHSGVQGLGKGPANDEIPPPPFFCARCQWVNCLRIGRRTGLSFLTQKQLWFPCPRQSNAKWDGHHMSSQDWSHLNFHQGALGILRVWLFQIILVLGGEGMKWVTRWVQQL